MKDSILVILTLIVLAGIVRADESRIPISAPNPTSQTIVINNPGTYILTRDINSSASPVIEITSDDVTIDLNGRTINNNGTGAAIDSFNSGITIRNGSIKGGAYGIQRSTQSATTLVVENVLIQNTTAQAILVSATATVTVRSCRMFNTNTSGSFNGALFVAGQPATGHIVDNQVTGTGSTGFNLSAMDSGEVTGNVLSRINTTGGSGIGIYVAGSGAIIDGNTVECNSTAAGSGISLALAGNLVSHNNIFGCNFGIVVVTKTQLIRENQIHGNINGIAVLAPGAINSLLDSNQIEDNTACGIDVNSGSGTVLKNNMLRGNGTAICGSAFIDGGGNIQ